MNAREQFEAWAKSRYMPLRVASTGEYWIETTQSAWEAWQASRAGIVVKLPETPNRGVGYGLFDAGKERCADAIRAAGLSIEE